MGGKQKRANEDVTIKRKKAKKVKYDSEKIADTEDPKPEILDIKTVREGMLLLGCITNIRRTSFDVSLPGCISGVVEANNISNEFSKVVATADDADLEMFSIDSVIEVGMVLPFKVIKIDHDSHKGRKTAQIFLSMKPDDINSNLKPSSLFHKMVLFVSICSIEDHGFVVDVGIESVRGFLPKCNCDSEVLQVGQVIPTCIQNILFSDKKSAKIQLYKLDFNQEFPKVSVENIKLHSILPGAKICADVIDVQKHFVIMKYLDFDVCASLFSNGSINTSIHTGNRVEGTVLFVNPITNMIHLALHSTTIPKLFPQWFQLKKFETVGNPKFLYFYKNRAYYKISKGIYGFINIWDLPAAESGTATMLSLAKISKACVLSLHYMDKLIQMTAKPSITAKTIILPDEVNIGDILDAVVQRHEEDGMFVRICIGLYGFVRRLHMADIYVTKPEALFPVGKNVRCRVLYSDGKGKINLTCKESLLDIHKSCLLSSYERVKKNEFYTGVVVKICDTYILVLFFNNVKGIVSTPHISPGAVFFTGQTVVCKVLECNPETKKLKLSLLTEGLSSNDQIKQDKMSKQSVKRFLKGVSNISHPSSSKQLNKNRQILETSKSDEIDLSDEEKIVDSSKGLNSHLCTSNSPKPVQAVIKNVKGHQLNILLKSARGRVHITELECTSEGIYPLKEFSSNQKIQVYVIGEFVGKRINFLEINHRNKTIYKECSLKYPPVAYSVDFKCGDSVIGFVKEAHDVCATLWLSPTETGVLDYLHFSKNPKVVRKLRQHLKIGLSLKVSILDNTFQKRKNGQCFSLTKIENYRPEVDKNILGLVQIACLDRGLIVKLPFGYHGSVSVTDLTDVYVPVHNLFKKYQKLKFMLCHVLKVDHQTKYCSLSLRKTRLFPKITMCDSFCPELTPQNIKQGDSVKGLVKFASDSSVTVAIGRNLEGKLGLHSCSLTDCRSCKVAKGIINKYPAGSVIDVIIQGASDNNKTFILAHSEFNFGKNPKCGRLSVEEDITWEEMQ